MFPGNMGNMLKQAQQMQARMAKLKEELALRDVTASAGGGAVTVTATCDLKLKSVIIQDELAKSGDKEMLQDLVLAACNAALDQAQSAAGAEMSKLTGGFKLPF
ncbi:MAG TPA: YbaB/EbfC family nucleoid-associated protein [bacterium]|jgi:DNA-binding YbaB/EbfC family protein|nr:YbaB/EbfC family nucleoid-associated protein [bacterium]